MSTNPFTPRFEDLPDDIGIFPLPGAVCLPGQSLPLNVFEPRYLALVDDALASGRMFAMIQPRANDEGGDGLYGVGCACRIAAFQETDDGRYIIQLTGVCRFDLVRELDVTSPFRRVSVDWGRFADDLSGDAECDVTFDELKGRLDAYATANSLNVQWDGVQKLPGAYLVDLLAVSLPFSVEEKQALVEATSVQQRLAILETALVMGAAQTDATPANMRH